VGGKRKTVPVPKPGRKSIPLGRERKNSSKPRNTEMLIRKGVSGELYVGLTDSRRGGGRPRLHEKKRALAELGKKKKKHVLEERKARLSNTKGPPRKTRVGTTEGFQPGRYKERREKKPDRGERGGKQMARGGRKGSRLKKGIPPRGKDLDRKKSAR